MWISLKKVNKDKTTYIYIYITKKYNLHSSANFPNKGHIFHDKLRNTWTAILKILAVLLLQVHAFSK